MIVKEDLAPDAYAMWPRPAEFAELFREAVQHSIVPDGSTEGSNGEVFPSDLYPAEPRSTSCGPLPFGWGGVAFGSEIGRAHV